VSAPAIRNFSFSSTRSSSFSKNVESWFADLSEGLMINPRSLDHIVGLVVGFGCGIAMWGVHKLMKDHKADSLRRGDAVHSERYGKSQSSAHCHVGSCHCMRVRFQIYAGRCLRAVDIKSKIRFPRVTVPVNNFEALTDDSVMSHYAVKSGGSIGIYTFCSFCGVHVVFAPSVNPTEVHVNMDCLERTNVQDAQVTYMSTAESSPCSVAYDDVSGMGINKKGVGANISMSGRLGDSPQNAVAGMVAMYDGASLESPVQIQGGQSSWGGNWPNGDRCGTIGASSFDLVGNNPGENTSPNTTPAKGNFAFDSPMHRQLQKHLQQYLNNQPSEGLGL